MALSIEISDDELVDLEKEPHVKGFDSTLLSSDEGDGASSNVTSDDDLPAVEIAKKKAAVIDNLFPKSSTRGVHKPVRHDTVFKKKPAVASTSTCEHTKDISNAPQLMSRDVPPGVIKMIAGVSVNLPVNPYGSQLALMSTLIRALKNSQNCLLESPTGTGKTLALLCGALAWLTAEKNNIEKQKSEQYFRDIHECDECSLTQPSLGSGSGSPPRTGAADGSPMKTSTDVPDNMFQKTTFGEKSIYDSPDNDSIHMKRKELSPNSSQDSPVKSQVHIHKRPKLGATNSAGELLEQANRQNQGNCCVVPRIYYGARTHKQLEQVIKEYRRTSYCSQLKMSLLSSRDYSCIRDFDRHQWPTRNEMCRACVKKVKNKSQVKGVQLSNCKYYDNRAALRHDTLPPAFDLEDLVKAGHELTACPYFAARDMVAKADIVFCPYNYLIDPLIAESMRISLANSVVIIDEAHNIEDVCRDAATFALTRDHLTDALKELEVASQGRYSTNAETLSHIDSIILTLKNWDQWFVNQSQLVSNVPLVNNEAVHLWQSEHFVTTLTNHNIGPEYYPAFQASVCQFSQTLQNSPESLAGVTQATGALLDSLTLVLGYLFRENCQYMDDYKPALVRTTADNFHRTSFKKKEERISLRLMCMNPAVVFSRSASARTVVLASGTLTPLLSLESELGAHFPLKISPKHVISPDRVWIGTLSSDEQGRALSCRSADTQQPATRDALGAALLSVCRHTPHGVLAFLPSYHLMNTLVTRWQETGVWDQLTDLKHVFLESKNAKDHNDNMEDYYKYVSSEKGALLLAVYRGKVSEGMDFKDHQARAVVTVGVPYPNTYDMCVKAKMQYNERHCRSRGLLSGQMWLKVQAYRALNQAVGRCVRHARDWGAVLLLDARFTQPAYTEHLSKWLLNFLQQNHHTHKSLTDSPQGLASFMQAMKIADEDELMADL